MEPGVFKMSMWGNSILRKQQEEKYHWIICNIRVDGQILSVDLVEVVIREVCMCMCVCEWVSVFGWTDEKQMIKKGGVEETWMII